MSNILPLVKNQFNTMYAARKQTGVFVIMSIILPIIQPTMIMWSGFFIGVILMLNTMSYEYKSGIDNLIATLPVKAEEFILSRYILGLILSGIAMLLCATMYGVNNIIGNISSISAIGLDGILISLGLVVVVLIALLIPVQTIFGPEKGRLIMLMFAMIPMLGSMYILEDGGVKLAKIMTYIMGMNKLLLVVGVALVITLIIYISFLITCNVYRKKEI